MLASSCSWPHRPRHGHHVGRAGGRSLAGDEGAGVDPDHARRGNAVVVIRAGAVRPGCVVGDRPRTRHGVLRGAALRRPHVDSREPRAGPPPHAVQSGCGDAGRSDPRPDEARARGRRCAREPTCPAVPSVGHRRSRCPPRRVVARSGDRDQPAEPRSTPDCPRAARGSRARSLAAGDPFRPPRSASRPRPARRPPCPKRGRGRALDAAPRCAGALARRWEGACPHRADESGKSPGTAP